MCYPLEDRNLHAMANFSFLRETTWSLVQQTWYHMVTYVKILTNQKYFKTINQILFKI